MDSPLSPGRRCPKFPHMAFVCQPSARSGILLHHAGSLAGKTDEVRVAKDVTSAQLLLAEAATLFRKKGYAGTTTRELAAKVGLQNASLYHHMAKKEDLLYNICVNSLHRMGHEVQEAISAYSDPRAQLRAMMIRHMEVVLSEGDAHATMLIELRSLSAARRRKVVQLRNEYEARLRQVIINGQATGAIRADVEAKYLTLAMFSLVNWAVFWFRDDGDLAASQLGELFGQLFLEGVAPTKARGARLITPARATL